MFGYLQRAARPPKLVISHGLALVLLAGVLSACDRTVIVRGEVLDIQDTTLPGVAVTVLGEEEQAVTDGIGRYRLRCRPGPLELSFLKTGFTPGRLRLELAEERTVTVQSVKLWPLPQGKGVYLFENYRYRSLKRTEPKRYIQKDGPARFGVKIPPEEGTLENRPLLIAYKLPPYDLKLHRLEPIKASMPQEDPPTFALDIWVGVEEAPVIAIPIDEPERLLLELRPVRALVPGVYAAHWGALDGYTSTELRVFLFRIFDPDAPAETPESEEEEAPEAEAPATGSDA